MDGLRAAAAMAVVMIHTTAGAAGWPAVCCNQLARFSVPLFLMLSGFGHAQVYTQSGQMYTGGVHSAWRRLKRVLPAYLVWSAAYLLLEAAAGAPHAHPVRDILTGKAYMHLYYIPVLVQFIVLSGPLQRSARRFPRGTLAIAAAVSLAAQAVLCAQTMGLLRLPAFPISPTVCFLPWTVFYVGGALLRRQVERGMPRLSLCVWLWAASAAAVLGTAKLLPAVRALSLRPDITAYAFTSFLLLWALCSLPQDVPRPVRAVSRLSFGLYLSHPLVMRLWIEWTTRRPKVVYLRFWQLWLLAFAGGLLIAAVLAILPHGSLLGGAPRKKTKQTEGQNGEKT